MISPITHIKPLACIRRARMLETEGFVRVRVGQKVSAVDVIAEVALGDKHLLLDIRRSLGISRSVNIREVLKHKIGDKLQEGDLIAEFGSMFKRVVTAPAESIIVAVSGGKVLLEMQQTTSRLLSGITGQVIEVFPGRGAVVETNGSLIQGVWGNGRINMGTLLVKAPQQDHEFTKEDLDVSMRGAVVFSGHCSSKEPLQAAADLPLRGLILGSMTSDLIPFVEKLDFPVILLDGFGCMPVNTAAFKVLSTSEKREISLNSARWTRLTGERPEIFIPLPANGQIPVETGSFQPGQRVRVQMPPFSGRIGVIEKIYTEPYQLSNNLREKAAEIRFENQKQVAVPLSNLDMLE